MDTPLVMAIVNVTPDSFSDGGACLSPESALHKADRLVAEGADILDIGGESTRPGSSRVPEEEEMRRILPVIEMVASRFDVPISIDTSKSGVARRAIDAGAEIVNDISGLRFDAQIADVCSATRAGLVLMHSRGDYEEMHSQPPVEDIFDEVTTGLRRSLAVARGCGVSDDQIVFDIGLGFGKTFEQNLDLLARLDRIVEEFADFPILVGSSRKSFIGRILDDAPVERRLGGSLATALLALSHGARIVRVHDVEETVSAIRVLQRIHHRG